MCFFLYLIVEHPSGSSGASRCSYVVCFGFVVIVWRWPLAPHFCDAVRSPKTRAHRLAGVVFEGLRHAPMPRRPLVH